MEKEIEIAQKEYDRLKAEIAKAELKLSNLTVEKNMLELEAQLRLGLGNINKTDK